MEKSIRNDAINNLKTTRLKDYSIAPEDLNKLSGWTYIAMFLMEAKTSLTLSEKHNEQAFTKMEQVVLAHGMFKNFILSYSKCFSSSGKGKISIDANSIFSDRPDLRTVHDRIMQTRNTYVAHNDENDFDLSLSVTTEDDTEIVLAQTYTLLTPLSEYKSFLETIEYCESQVIIKYNEKVDKVQKKIGKEIKFE